MRLAVVVGTRPEIIKMAPVVRACADAGLACDIIHTGQHYSWGMDGVFFEELGLPPPSINLHVGSGSHAFQIGSIVTRMEQAIVSVRPDVLLVEGDTNSVLGAAITANKMRIRVGHVEAGLRSYDRSMPEETNRILVDHLADLLFAPTQAAAATLRSEGVPDDRIHQTGNTVVDELLYQRDRLDAGPVLARFGVEPRGYALATVHRAENVTDDDRLRGVFRGVEGVADALGVPVLAALHPRTAERLGSLGIGASPRLRPLPPLGYLDFLALHASTLLVLTDSGGLQEEACSLGVPCVTLRDNTERPESITVGANVLAGADPDRIVTQATRMAVAPRTWVNPFGDGLAGRRIVDVASRSHERARAPIPIESDANIVAGSALAERSDRERSPREVGESVTVS